MPITLSTKTAKRIKEQMKRLGYANADDLVFAGLVCP
jgi:hypothetical protein